MRNPMDVIGAAARSDDAARYGVGLTVLKALRDEWFRRFGRPGVFHTILEDDR